MLLFLREEIKVACISFAFFKCHPPEGTAVFRQTPKYASRGGGETAATSGTGQPEVVGPQDPSRRALRASRQAEPVSNFPLGGCGCSSVTKAITRPCKSFFPPCFKILLKIKQKKNAKQTLACNIVWPSSLKAGRKRRSCFKSKGRVPPRLLLTKREGGCYSEQWLQRRRKKDTQRHIHNLCAQASFNKAP